MYINEAIIQRIVELCNRRGITVNRLAISSGVTQSTLSNIVSGRNKSTTISTIQKICDGLGISIQEFFTHPIFEKIEQEVR